MNDNQANEPKFSIVNEGPLDKPLAEFIQGNMAKTTDKHATNRVKDILSEEDEASLVPITKAAIAIGCSPQTITRNSESLGVVLHRRGFAKMKRVFLHKDDVERLKKLWFKR